MNASPLLKFRHALGEEWRSIFQRWVVSAAARR